MITQTAMLPGSLRGLQLVALSWMCLVFGAPTASATPESATTQDKKIEARLRSFNRMLTAHPAFMEELGFFESSIAVDSGYLIQMNHYDERGHVNRSPRAAPLMELSPELHYFSAEMEAYTHCLLDGPLSRLGQMGCFHAQPTRGDPIRGNGVAVSIEAEIAPFIVDAYADLILMLQAREAAVR